MRFPKLFEEFIKEGIVNRIAINKERVRSLTKESERKMVWKNCNSLRKAVHVRRSAGSSQSKFPRIILG